MTPFQISIFNITVKNHCKLLLPLNDYFTMLFLLVFFLSMEWEGEGERVHFAWKQAVSNTIFKGEE
jgi:hypothetical protein